MYAPTEASASRQYLTKVTKLLEGDYCLVGGWAVYETVREGYQEWAGIKYIASKDIDLGLPDIEALRHAQHIFVDLLGFTRLSFRYVRYLDFDTGRQLTAEEVRTKPSYEIFPLYIDAMLPVSGESARIPLGFVPPDEPLLAQVFSEESSRTWAIIEGSKVAMPTPDILLAMKLNAVLGRADDQKRLKDVCDIAALGLFSGIDTARLLNGARKHMDRTKLQSLPQIINEEMLERAMTILNIEPPMIRAVLSGLLEAP